MAAGESSRPELLAVCRLQRPNNRRPARARHSHAIVLDGRVQLAAVLVLEDEGFERVAEGGGHAYSITWSARGNRVCGIVSRSALAVFRLITNSNVVGRSTGQVSRFCAVTSSHDAEGWLPSRPSGLHALCLDRGCGLRRAQEIHEHLRCLGTLSATHDSHRKDNGVLQIPR